MQGTLRDEGHTWICTLACQHGPPACCLTRLQAQPTAVFLMGGRNLPQIVGQLLRHGKPSSMPVAVIRQAAGAEQAVWRGTLAEIVDQTAGERLSPCILVVGHIANLFPSFGDR